MMKIFCTSSWKTRIFSGVVLVGLLGASTLVAASKKDDTMRFAYDQAPESVDPYFNNVRIGVIICMKTMRMVSLLTTCSVGTRAA